MTMAEFLTLGWFVKLVNSDSQGSDLWPKSFEDSLKETGKLKRNCLQKNPSRAYSQKRAITQMKGMIAL